MHYPLFYVHSPSITSIAQTKINGASESGQPLAPSLSPAFEKFLDSIKRGASVPQAVKYAKTSTDYVYALLRVSDRAKEMYAQAREERRELRFEAITDIAGKAKPENAHVARLQVDVIKWQLSKEEPTKYGDHATGVVINNNTNVMLVSDAQLEKLQQARQRLIAEASTVTQ